MDKSKTAVTISAVLGKTASVIGYTFGAFALLIIIAAIKDMDTDEGAVTAMICSAIVLPFCIFLIFKGIQIKKRISRFNKYASITAEKQITSLDKISASTSQSVDFVRKDLQKMIDKGFFVNVHIDMKTDEFVIHWRDIIDFGEESRTLQDMRPVIKTEAAGCSGGGASDTEAKKPPVNGESIEYGVTENDLRDAYEHDLKKPLLQRGLLYYGAFYLMAMIFFIVLMLLTYLDAPTPFLVLSIIAVPVAGILLANFFNRQNRAARIVRDRLRSGEVNPQYFGRHRLELKEDGIEQRYGTICTKRAYAGIHKIVEYPGGIMVYNSQLDRDIIPSTAFENPQQRGAFLNTLQARISQAKNVGISNQAIEEHKQETNYVLEYTWDEASFITALTRASRLLFKTRIGWPTGQIIMTLSGLFFCLAGILSFVGAFVQTNKFYFEMITLLPGGLCCGVGLGLLSPLFMAFTPLGKKMYRKQIDNGAISQDYFRPQSLCFKEDRITELRRLSCYDVMYDMLYCVRHDADGMYILLKGRRFFVVPNSAFSSDDRKWEIINYIENKIKGKAS